MRSLTLSLCFLEYHRGQCFISYYLTPTLNCWVISPITVEYRQYADNTKLSISTAGELWDICITLSFLGAWRLLRSVDCCSYCTSTLEYCNVLYIGFTLKSIQKCQLVQNAMAITVLYKTRFYTRLDMPFVLWEFHWLSIYFQVEFKVVVIIFKALYGLMSDATRLTYEEFKQATLLFSCLFHRNLPKLAVCPWERLDKINDIQRVGPWPLVFM